MTDRNVQYPNRFHVKPVPGTDDICEIIPAPGTVYEDGTFWNKANVLQDAVAALYDKDASATPNDIFATIRDLIADSIDIANSHLLCMTGGYSGNSGYQTINTGSIYWMIIVILGSVSGNPRFGIALKNGIYGINNYELVQSGIYPNALTVSGSLNQNGGNYYYIAIG